MKKCYFILGLILTANSASAVTNQTLANTVKNNVTKYCIELFNESGPVKEQAKMKKFCSKVANCVVDNAPGNYALQDTNYMQVAMLQCISNEANNL